MKKRILNNKKGAVDPILALGGLVCAVLIIILIVTIFEVIIHNAVVGEASYVTQDLGSMIETTYAAPENLAVTYNVPTGGDGYPVLGSLLLNAEKDELCVSSHSEDEMWMRISNKALTAWGVGVGVQAISKIRKMQREHALHAAAVERSKLLLEADKYSLLNAIEGQNMDLISKDLTQIKVQVIDDAMDASASTAGLLADPKGMEAISKLGKEYPDLIRTADDAAYLGKMLKKGGWRAEEALKIRFGKKAIETIKKDPDGILNIIKNNPAALDFLGDAENIENFRKGGRLWDDVLFEVSSNTPYLKGAARYSGTIDTGKLLNRLATEEGYEASRFLKTRRGSEIRKSLSNADDAAKLKDFGGKYGDDLAELGQKLGPKRSRKLLSMTKNMDKSDDIVKVIGKNWRFSAIKNVDETADAIIAMKKSYPNIYKQLKGPGMVRKATGKIPGVSYKSALKNSDNAWRFTSEGGWKFVAEQADVVFKNPDAGKTFLRKGFWKKMYKGFPGSKLKYAITKKAKNFATKVDDLLYKSQEIKAQKLMTESDELARKAALADNAKDIAKYTKKSDKLFTKGSKLADIATTPFWRRGPIRNAAAEAGGKIAAKIASKGGKGMLTGMKVGSSSFGLAGAMKACMCYCCGIPYAPVKEIIGGVTTVIPSPCDKVEISYCGLCPAADAGGPFTQVARAGCWICKGSAVATWFVLMGIDFYTTTLPLTMMIHAGHVASDEERNGEHIYCHTFSGAGGTVYADPPNREPDFNTLSSEQIFGVDNSKWFSSIRGFFGNLFSGAMSLMDIFFGGKNFPFPAPDCTDKAIKAGHTEHYDSIPGDCPNIYISMPSLLDWGDTPDFLKKYPNVKALGPDVIIGGPAVFCSALGVWKLTAGLGCYITYYGGLITAFQKKPGQTANFMLNSGIFPWKDYYYMQFPGSIEIEKTYDLKTKETQFNLRKGS